MTTSVAVHAPHRDAGARHAPAEGHVRVAGQRAAARPPAAGGLVRSAHPAPGARRSPATLGPALRQVGSFATIGVASTAAYVLLFAVLRTVAPAAAANALALVITAVGNTAANRRITFNVRGRDRIAQDHVAGMVALGAALAITSASLSVLGAVAPGAGRTVELGMLVVANGLATVVRFVLLRVAIGAPRAGDPLRAGNAARRTVRPSAATDRAARPPRPRVVRARPPGESGRQPEAAGSCGVRCP